MRRAIPVLLVAATLAFAQWVEDSIDVGGRFVGSLAYNPRSRTLYGGSNTGDFFFVIDCATNTVVANLEADYPCFLAHDSTDNKVYGSFGYNGAESLLVIDGETHARIRAVPMAGANHLLWDPAPNRLYVSCETEDRLGVVDCTTDSILAFVPTGSEPHGLALNTRRRKLYVRNWHGRSVTVVDLNTLLPIETIPVPDIPNAGEYVSLVDKFYCTFYRGVLVIDGQGDSVLTTVQLPAQAEPKATTYVARSRVLLVGATLPRSDSAFAISVRDDTLLWSAPCGHAPVCLSWSPLSQLVYVAGEYDDNLTVLDDATGNLVKVIDVADAPYSIALAPDFARLYLSHLNCNMVYVIKDRAGGVTEQEPVRVERLPGPTVMRASDLARFEGRILDALGRGVRSSSSDFGVRTSHLPPGVYFLKYEVQTPNAELGTRKVVVTR